MRHCGRIAEREPADHDFLTVGNVAPNRLAHCEDGLGVHGSTLQNLELRPIDQFRPEFFQVESLYRICTEELGQILLPEVAPLPTPFESVFDVLRKVLDP